MKKMITFLVLLLLPFVVYGAECSNDGIEIKNVELVNTNGNAEVINDAKIVGGKLVFDIKFSKLEDSADYKVLLKNTSEEEFTIDENSIVSNSKNIKYTISFLEDSRVVEPGKEKYVVLTIKYDTKIDDSLFNSDNEYPIDDEMSFSLVNDSKEESNTEVPVYEPPTEEPKNTSNEIKNNDTQNEDNPITKGGIKLMVIIAIMSLIIIALALFGYKKGSKALLILMILSIPLIAKAMCIVKIETNSHFVIEKYPNRKCYYDGELVKGAEYTNGQYVYRYLEQAGPGSSMFNDLDEGWSMRLADKSSTDPVTTEMCVYVNDIPVKSMSYAFFNSKAESIDLSSFNTTNIIAMDGMFRNISAPGLDLSTFNTINVKNMLGMFADNAHIKYIDFSPLDTSNVEEMAYMFAYYNPDSIDLSTFNTAKVKRMRQMFMYAKIADLDLSKWDTVSLEDAQEMFMYYEGHVNLHGFNTSNVTNMFSMFAYSKPVDLDVSTFDTRKVTNMDAIFGHMEYDHLDISNFNVDNLTSLHGLIGWSTLKTVDISGMRTTSLRKFTNNFTTCRNLETIYVNSEFDNSVLNNDNGLTNLSRTPKLKGGAGTDCSNVSLGDDVLYLRIDGGTSAPGCFTLKQ